MSITIDCPECDATLKFADKLAGKRVTCRDCGHKFLLEEEDDEVDDDEDDEDEEESPQKSEGAPVWPGIGAGAAIILLGLGLCILIATRKVPPPPPPPSTSPGLATPAVSQPVALFQESIVVINRVNGALTNVNDATTARAAISQLKAATQDVNDLINRASSINKPTDADVAKIKTMEGDFNAGNAQLKNQGIRIQQLISSGKIKDPEARDFTSAQNTYMAALQRLAKY